VTPAEEIVRNLKVAWLLMILAITFQLATIIVLLHRRGVF